jgi:mono/diheme cytochrome c family protein
MHTYRTRTIGHLCAIVALLLLTQLPASIALAADVARGKQLHDERCLLCHGLENYQAAASKIKSIKGLRAMVKRWEDKLKDPFTELEREDVVAYLNTAFYKFPQQQEISRLRPSFIFGRPAGNTPPPHADR